MFKQRPMSWGNDQWWRVDKDLEGGGRGLFELPSRYLSGLADEKHAIPQ